MEKYNPVFCQKATGEDTPEFPWVERLEVVDQDEIVSCLAGLEELTSVAGDELEITLDHSLVSQERYD